jgi:spermidine synthase
MAAEADEFIIHESLAHLAALSHPAPQRAIVLGGGDGASARELLKHPRSPTSPSPNSIARWSTPSTRSCRRSRRRLRRPSRASCSATPPAALKALHDQGERFDLILFDLTEPDDPACAHLHSDNFLRICAASLAPPVSPTSSSARPSTSQQGPTVFQRLQGVFATPTPALIDVPLYGGPGCSPGRAMPAPGSRSRHAQQRLEERGITGLRYYNPALHLASEALPNYVRDLLA